MKIVRCISCDGYGWLEDDFTGEVEDCSWCAGVGYVYRDGKTDYRIPPSDYEKCAAELERLEVERLREMGYQGSARKPWHQEIRKGTKLGQNPATKDTDDTNKDN